MAKDHPRSLSHLPAGYVPVSRWVFKNLLMRTVGHPGGNGREDDSRGATFMRAQQQVHAPKPTDRFGYPRYSSPAMAYCHRQIKARK